MKPASSAGKPVYAKPNIWVVAGIEVLVCLKWFEMLLLLEPQEVSFVDEDGVDKADYNDGEVSMH